MYVWDYLCHSFLDVWDSHVGPFFGNDAMLLLFQEVGMGKHWTASTIVFMT